MIMSDVYYKQLKLSAAVNHAWMGGLIKKFGSRRERLELSFLELRVTINATRVYTHWASRADWIGRNGGDFGGRVHR